MIVNLIIQALPQKLLPAAANTKDCTIRVLNAFIYLELECEHEDSIQLDQERVHWQTLVNMTMNLQVPQMEISLPPENVSSPQAGL